MDLFSLALPVLLALMAVAVYFVSIFNRLQSLRNGSQSTLSQIRVAMKKRLDMIEQLVDSVKSYARFERGTMENITRLRTTLDDAGPGDLTRINGASQGLLGSVQAVAENYPNLKTSEAVSSTMAAIREVEDEIARQRYTYNNIIQEFNTLLDTFPSGLVASSSGMRKLAYLNFEEDELRRSGYLDTEELEPRRPEAGWDGRE